jgi:membrane-associated protein
MEFFRKLYDLLRHLNEDEKWRAMIDQIGGIPSLYGLLCLIVFCETGLVVTPFLPGDSLLFFVGAKSASSIGIEPLVIAPLIVLAALVGDNVNYWLGRRLGPAVFKQEDEEFAEPSAASPNLEYARPVKKRTLKSRLLNRKHLLRAQEFYDQYGSKTVILARFVPIVRTFAPFVAGIGRMNYLRFLVFSFIGAVAWVSICVSAGYYFGQFEFVKKRFEVVIVAIVVISCIPMAIEFFNARRAAKRRAAASVEATPVDAGGKSAA